MRSVLVVFIILLIWPVIIFAQDKILVLDFGVKGAPISKSPMASQALRDRLERDGAVVVPAQTTREFLSRKGLTESTILSKPNAMKELAINLGARGAVYGEISSSKDIITTELRYIESGGEAPLAFDPIVTGNIEGLIAMMPEISRLILAPDKSQPHVLGVAPANGDSTIGQYAEIKVNFSKPMNPRTFSLTAQPENLWRRYGEVKYDSTTYTFVFKVHLYKGISYQFKINGADSKGFKDLAGNIAPEFVWSFKTAR